MWFVSLGPQVSFQRTAETENQPVHFAVCFVLVLKRSVRFFFTVLSPPFCFGVMTPFATRSILAILTDLFPYETEHGGGLTSAMEAAFFPIQICM